MTDALRTDDVPGVIVPKAILDEIRAAILFLAWCHANNRTASGGVAYEWLKASAEKLP